MLQLSSAPSGRYFAFEELQQISFLFHLFTAKLCRNSFFSPVQGLRRLLRELGRKEPVVFLEQTHSASVHWLDRQRPGPLRGDGLLTSAAGLLLARNVCDRARHLARDVRIMDHDICNDVIEDFAASEAALIDRVVDLTVERDAYRLVAVQAVHRLHDMAQQLDRLRDQHHRVQAEYRALRESIIIREAEAA